MPTFDPSNVDVEHFLETLGIENITKATAHEIRFSCPYPNHAGGDESPSAYMNIETSRFFCHACKEKGSAVDFAGYVLSISPLQAIRILKQAYSPGGINPDARDMVSEVQKILDSKVERIVQPILIEGLIDTYAVDWVEAWCEYEATGGTGFQPMTYFFDRGFEPESMMEWEFGWDDTSQRIVIPVRDEKGNLIGFKGRATDDRKPKYLVLGDKEGDKARYGFPRYYPSKVVFGAHYAATKLSKALQDKPLVVCEGELNAIAAIQKTDHAAVAINGSFFQPWHAKVIRQIAGDDGVVLFLDEDPAGLDCIWGRFDARGDWHPGMVELLSPHMPVSVISGHTEDAADLDRDGIHTLLDSAEPWLLAHVRRLR